MAHLLRKDLQILRRSPGPRDTAPDVGGRSPARMDRSVVLPAPLGPMIAITSPGAVANDTARTASRAP